MTRKSVALVCLALSALSACEAFNFGLDGLKGHLHGFNRGIGNAVHGHGMGVKSKFGHLFGGKLNKGNCETVYDEVCEEKCRTVYKDKCEIRTVSECSVVNSVECHEKLQKECNLAFEDKCTTLQIPYCNINMEETCTVEPECHTRMENQCAMIPKKVCKDLAPEPQVIHRYPEPVEILKPAGCCQAERRECCDDGGSSYNSIPDVTSFVEHGRQKRTIINKLMSALDVKEAAIVSKLNGKRALLAAIHAKKGHKLPVVQVAPVEVRTVCHDTTEERCSPVPREICQDVRKCKSLPKKTCGFSPKKHCVKFPTKKCVDVPKQVCVDVPKKTCNDVPKETCVPCPEKVCENVYVQRPREVCLPVQPEASAW